MSNAFTVFTEQEEEIIQVVRGKRQSILDKMIISNNGVPDDPEDQKVMMALLNDMEKSGLATASMRIRSKEQEVASDHSSLISSLLASMVPPRKEPDVNAKISLPNLDTVPDIRSMEEGELELKNVLLTPEDIGAT